MEWFEQDLQTLNLIQLFLTVGGSIFGSYIVTRNTPKRWKDK